MRRVGLLLLFVSAALARPAGAVTDEVWTHNNRAAGLQLDGLHDPTTSKDPTTAAVRLGDLTPVGAPCILEAPGANGLPVCSSLSGFAAHAPLVLTGADLTLTQDGTSITTSGGALQRMAIGGVVVIGAGSGTSTYPNAGAHTVLGNFTGSSAAPTFTGPGSAGQFLGASGWSTIPATSVTGLAAIATSGSATDLVTGTVPVAALPALLGAVTMSAGTNTTAFGTAGAHTVLGVSGGSIAIPTFIGPASAGQFFAADPSTGALGWTSTIPATSAPLAAGAVGFGSGTNLLTGDAANFHWDGTNFRLGLGTNAPAYQFQMQSQSTDTDFANRGFVETVYNGATNNSPLKRFQIYAGSLGSPAIVLNTSYMGTIAHEAYDGTTLLRSVQYGAHATGSTMAAGSLPSEWYLAIDPRGVSDPWAANNPLPIQATSVVDAHSGLLPGVAIGALPGLTTTGSALSVIGHGSSTFGHNARISLANSTVGADQGTVFQMSNDSTTAALTLKSHTYAGVEGTDALVLSSGSSGGSFWIEPDNLPVFQVPSGILLGSLTIGAIYLHQPGTGSGSSFAGMTLWTDSDTQHGDLYRTASTYTGGEGASTLNLTNQGQINFRVRGLQALTIQSVSSGTPSVIQGAALATSGVPDGYLYISTTAGAPTSTPTTHAGTAPIQVDTTNNTFNFYSSGAWQKITPFATALADTGANGIVVRTALDTTTARSITSTGGTLAITNGNGVSGNINLETVSAAPSGAAGGALTGIYPNPGVNVGAGASVTGLLPLANQAAPTATGFAHMTSGAWDSAARAVNLATGDVTGLLPAASVAPGTNTFVLTTVGGVAIWQAPAAPGVGTVTNVSMTAGDGTVASPTSTPVISLASVGPGVGPIGGSGIQSISLDARGRVTAAVPASYQAAISWPSANQLLYSTGSGLAGDATMAFNSSTKVADFEAIEMNGTSIPTNVYFIGGHTTNADRDRFQLFVGGGALGPTGTGDGSFVDIIPTSTAIRGGVTGGIYATERIRTVQYTGTGQTIGLPVGLYAEAPTVSGISSGTPQAIYSAGNTTVTGDLSVGNNVTFLLFGDGMLATSGGTGALTPIGVATANQDYYTSVSATTVANAFPANYLLLSNTGVGSNHPVEQPHPFLATHGKFCVNVYVNTIVSSFLSFQVTRNGAALGGSAVINLNSGVTGVQCTGGFATGSGSSSDAYGITVEGSGSTIVVGSPNLEFSTDLQLSRYAF